MRFTLPFPPAKLSPNARIHWGARARLVEKTRWQAKMLAMSQGARKMDAERLGLDARIIITPPDKHARDFDNMVSSCKALIDGVADAVGVDDSRWDMRFERAEPAKPGSVVIELEAAAL